MRQCWLRGCARGAALLEGAVLLPILTAFIIAVFGVADLLTQAHRMKTVVREALTEAEPAALRLSADGFGGFEVSVDEARLYEGVVRIAAGAADRVGKKLPSGGERSFLIEAAYGVVPVDPLSGAPHVEAIKFAALARGALTIDTAALLRTDLRRECERLARRRRGLSDEALLAVSNPLAGEDGPRHRPVIILVGVRVFQDAARGPLKWLLPLLGLEPFVSSFAVSELRGDFVM